MDFYGSGDLNTLLGEFGVPVTWDGTTARGIVDEVDVQMMSGEGASFAGRQTTVTVKTGAFDGIAANASVLVAGVQYRVISVAQVDDGALTRLLCAK